MSQSERELLLEAQQIIKEQSAELERIGQGAMKYGIVYSVEGEKTFVMVEGNTQIVETVKDCVEGESVFILPMTGQIVKKCDYPGLGYPADVVSVTQKHLEIKVAGESQYVSKGKIKDVEQGDQVIVDPQRVVAIKILQKASKKNTVDVNKITWDQIGGNQEAKQLLREAVELPHLHPEIFQHYNKKPTSGILMFGPPGCGKTLLAQAVATSIGATSGGFLSIKGPEILDPYVGVAEQGVRSLFSRARDFKRKTGKSAVIFIDEAESILARRGGNFSYMEKTIVPAFLAEMQGMEDSGAIVILATNREDQLDPAIIRDGRIDFKISVERPLEETAAEIFDIHMKTKPVCPTTTGKVLTEAAINILYSQENRWLPYSGALLAGVVDKAVTAAIRRDITNGSRSGIKIDDINWAVGKTIDQEKFQKKAA